MPSPDLVSYRSTATRWVGRNEHMRAATVCADHDAHLHRTLSPNDPGVERTGWILFRAYSAGRVWRRASSQPLNFYVWLR